MLYVLVIFSKRPVIFENGIKSFLVSGPDPDFLLSAFVLFGSALGNNRLIIIDDWRVDLDVLC